MDFGDILNKWEESGGASDKINISSNTDKNFQKKVHPMDAWLRTNKIIDKDAQGEAAHETISKHEAASLRRRQLRNKKPDDSIDIHGLTYEEAWIALNNFFQKSKRNGFEKILIIHGKGNHSRDKAVLKHCVRDFIEKCPFAGESGQSDTGGTGATWVLLKISARGK